MRDPVAASTLQFVDRYCGIPLCAVLSWTNQVAKLAGAGRRASARPEKILFVKFAEQGSTVLARSAIQRALDLVGRDNVFFVVFKENRFILDVLGLVADENVITIRRDNVVTLARDTLAALRRIRGLRIDTAIDMEFFSRASAALTYLTGAPRRVGFHTFFGEGPYRGDLMTHRILYNPYHHTSQIFRLLVEATAEDPGQLPTRAIVPEPLDSEPPVFVMRDGEADVIRAILREASGGAAPQSLLLLNPNASDLLPLRKWPTERYVELAQRLLKQFPQVYIALTGAPAEAGPAERVASQVGSPRCFSLAGRTTLRQLMVLYSLSDLLITNDSGPAHFAALTPTNVITLFGPETPRLFGAPTRRSTPIWLGLACSPCVNAYNNRQSPCHNNLCMQGITVDRVFSEAVQVLEKRWKNAAEPIGR